MRTLSTLVLLSLTIPGLSGEKPREKESDTPKGTIAFPSLAPRSWDVYITDLEKASSRRLTDHSSLDYNAVFSADGKQIAFVSERDGNMELYSIKTDGSGLKRLTTEFALDDHPTWSPYGKQLAFVSTREAAEKPGQAWNAVYAMNVDGSEIRRLTPKGTADYSPSWSPRGGLVAVASGSGATGGTDLYVMKADGTGRQLVVKNGGWPSFASDGETLFFHSRREEKWGIWRVRLDGSKLERVTPVDVEAYTPHVAAGGKVLAYAIKQGSYRQIEVMDLESGKRQAVTKGETDHWNPSISPDGRHLVYHKTTPDLVVPNVEVWQAPPETRLTLARLAGSFPAFAPDGKRVAVVSGGFAGLDVMNLDGSNRKTIYSGKKTRNLFSLSWAHDGERIAFSEGGVFQAPDAEVNIGLVAPDGSDYKKLTASANNGFPSFAPDGMRLVFRSGREGSKNLYIMNRDGSGVRRLTEGKWTDTMNDWSPKGDWIVFASDREKNYEIWAIRPDGTGLRKVIGDGGRNNHPHFSPDGKWIVFASQRASYSAEEISLPRQPQPYGDIFAVRFDGTGLLRLTHTPFEEGTPAWSPIVNLKPSIEGRKAGAEY